MNEHVPGTKLAERLLTSSTGATMDELIAATGGPKYNLLRALEVRGYAVRRVREGRATRYFATPPAAPAFEATITRRGQVTIPKEVREALGLRGGGKVRFALKGNNQVIVTPASRSILDSLGILPRPARKASLKDMDEAIRRSAVERYLRSTR